VPNSVLLPRDTWSDKEAYDRQAAHLAARFKENFKQFELVGDDVRQAGPR
jgi:phosphoenolpyruvate carboxykinase (ATP)